MLVPKLLLTPLESRIFSPKTAEICPKYAFLVILGQVLLFLPISSNSRPKNNANKVLKWVFRYVGNKTFDFSSKKRIFCSKTTKFSLKFLSIAGSFCAPSWDGWWLWRAGCISQDTYLLYILDIIKMIFQVKPEHCWSVVSPCLVFFSSSSSFKQSDWSALCARTRQRRRRRWSKEAQLT